MAQNTEHYNLVKPDYTDPADVSQLNDNMDTIDGILWQLANAGADDELLAKVQEILDKIGETDDTGGSTVAGTVMAKLNDVIDMSESDSTKMDTIIQLLGSGVQEWKEPGSYQFQIPTTITKLKITACGGGGGGANGASSTAGGGGGGGAAIVDQEFSVTPNEIIEITVGAGGAGIESTIVGDGFDGQATVIGGLITLPGGKGGINGYHNSSDNKTGLGGDAGGAGGGKGGNGVWYDEGDKSTNPSSAGQNGIQGTGGSGTTPQGSTTRAGRGAGGGGGGSLGNGTAGKNAAQFNVKNKATRGGGGGGAGYGYYQSQNKYGKGDDGGDGYVKIVWGY